MILSSKAAVRSGLLEAGIPIREQHLHHGHPSQPKYGQQIRKQKIATHKKELRIIQSVKHMRKKGDSLRAIANQLENSKVATKCKRKWHPETVRRILGGLQ
jgi:hypothetical protein